MRFISLCGNITQPFTKGHKRYYIVISMRNKHCQLTELYFSDKKSKSSIIVVQRFMVFSRNLVCWHTLISLECVTYIIIKMHICCSRGRHWQHTSSFQLHQMFQQQPIEPPSDKKPDCFPILTDPSSLFQHRESGSGVIGTAYTPLPQQYDVSLGNKSATLPQCSSAKNSPHRGIKTGIFDMGHGGVRTPGSSSSPAHSLQSTPSQSPRLHRKYNDLGVIQKPGAIDNTPLITPSTSTKVKLLLSSLFSGGC